MATRSNGISGFRWLQAEWLLHGPAGNPKQNSPTPRWPEGWTIGTLEAVFDDGFARSSNATRS